MKVTALSPWAESKYKTYLPLQPRLDDLNGKKIGLFSHFKEHTPYLMKELELLLKSKYPTAEFIHYVYPVDTCEIFNDETNHQSFLEWVDSVDGVIGGYGDAGSCAMYVAFNMAYVEKLGKPAVMLTDREWVNSSQRGAASRALPGLRLAVLDATGVVPEEVEDLTSWAHGYFGPQLEKHLDEIVSGLTAARTEEELTPPEKPDYAGMKFSGTCEEIANVFYRHGWTDGSPINIPTEEAVKEMLRGTDLPRDHVVAYLPPMAGAATVEKIAVNAVMAGCLPTYLPILIAAVRGMVDPRIHLEGYTCSCMAWAPMIILNGPVRKAININIGRGTLSPYDKPSSSIPRALGFIIMNICGVRPRLEDMAQMGHENRFGVCIGEDEENSPWVPLHTDYGFEAEDSAVTLFWPNTHSETPFCTGPLTRLTNLLTTYVDGGFDPGCAYVLCPEAARTFAKAGWSKQDVIDYIYEYNRRPYSSLIRMITGNNHPSKGIRLPIPGSRPDTSVKTFFTTDHLMVIVSGQGGVVTYSGGGSHGGPSCTKIDLPTGWEKLVAEYRDIKPEYVNY